MGFPLVVFTVSEPGRSRSQKAVNNAFFNPVIFPICAKKLEENGWGQWETDLKGREKSSTTWNRIEKNLPPSTFCLNQNKMCSFTSKSYLTFPPSNCKLPFPNKKLKTFIENVKKEMFWHFQNDTFHFNVSHEMPVHKIKISSPWGFAMYPVAKLNLISWIAQAFPNSTFQLIYTGSSIWFWFRLWCWDPVMSLQMIHLCTFPKLDLQPASQA